MVDAMSFEARIEAAAAALAANAAKAELELKALLSDVQQSKTSTDREKEAVVLLLGECYQKQHNTTAMAELIKTSRSFLLTVSKAKSAKTIRQLMDLFAQTAGDRLDLQIQVCRDNITWAETEKRIYLKQNLETRLVALLLENKNYTEALSLIASLLRELKRLDDKAVLVEVQLLESRVYHGLKNLPKSRAALTSARTSANAIYCPPLMQAQLDMQSGILHAEEKDYKTAYSYFFETLENYSALDDPRAVLALKYMLLCKIMLNLTSDVHSIINGKLTQKYGGRAIDAMKAVASAHQARSLQAFEQALVEYKDGLGNDPIIHTHLAALYDTLLEQNLLRIIEPYSRVDIAHVALQVNLPTVQVEAKLSQMILDKVFHGILDQGAGALEVFEDVPADKTYEATLDTIKNMGAVVDALYEKAALLT